MRVFDIDFESVDRARAFLGVTNKPKFKISYGMRQEHLAEVTHDLSYEENTETGERRNFVVHATIKVNGCLSVEMASEAIWHELAHMAQYERDGYVESAQRYSRDVKTYGYHSCPMEVEARHVAATMHPLLPLTTPRKEEG